jgi:serine phosphatase RsbU (regulator of sigma subunit)
VYTFWAEVPLPSALSGSILRFDDFQLDCGRFELRCRDRILRLERKPMELLILLASREGQLVTRTEIAEQLWSSGVFVDTEHGINTAIRKLRHLLHDTPDDPRFIQTVTGMGYRFIAPITTVDEVALEARAASATAAVIEPAETQLLMAVSLGLLLLRRLLLSVRRPRVMALDLKQAQEVQRVLMPKEQPPIAGLAIETEYRPACEVGGDFFQIVEHPTDGSVLIVAGDVVGKGLKAGMLVALLVGAIRTATDTSLDPEFVLGVLNKRLLRRGDAQATCLALSIAKDGEATLANAGHMAPYLNGEALPMEGALPLGMIEGAEPSLMRFKLAVGDKLLLMSDGIAEAMDADGQLFGFDRIHDLLRTATTAAQLASAAQSFGQDDDISVISVTRTGALEHATA